ncbi:hypothetical protein Bpla01_25620 [Burkholderia plantarii]|nr:hypothetical protein Bpla01_25620 [Burkholderia plantarii]
MQGGRIVQAGPPVFALVGDLRLVGRLVFQLVVERREFRCLAETVRVVGGGQVVEKDPQRPAVEDDVVHVHQQHVMDIVDPHQQRAHRRLGAQVEGMRGFALDLLVDRLLDALRRRGREIQPTQGRAGVPGLDHELLALAAEAGTQRGMALRQRRQGAFQRVDVEPAAQADHERHVVGGGGDVVAGHQPQTPLRVGRLQAVGMGRAIKGGGEMMLFEVHGSLACRSTENGAACWQAPGAEWKFCRTTKQA